MDPRGEISAFWDSCRTAVDGLPEALPEAWAFGATPRQADELLELVLSGTKTETASSLWDYEFDDEPLPVENSFSIVLDGRGLPAAVIQTVSVSIVPFSDVTEAHAYAEGEGDRSLRSWREDHEHYWREHSSDARRFDLQMPVVCEQLRLVYPAPVASDFHQA